MDEADAEGDAYRNEEAITGPGPTLAADAKKREGMLKAKMDYHV